MPRSKPDYREIPRWSPNHHGRGGARITNFFLHTQEGNGTAETLAGYLQQPSSAVSYHYTVDNGGTVCDVVDTDRCSWSVLDANPISINLCFAGSYADWNRTQWLDRMGRALEIAAWLAVQDCHKYAIPTDVIAPPYRRAAGISDHRYVTYMLGFGTHTDVGTGFPWDVFARHVHQFTTDPGGLLMALSDAEQRELLGKVREIHDQLTGPGAGFAGWEQTGGRTLTDTVAAAAAQLGVAGCTDPQETRQPHAVS